MSTLSVSLEYSHEPQTFFVINKFSVTLFSCKSPTEKSFRRTRITGNQTLSLDIVGICSESVRLHF